MSAARRPSLTILDALQDPALFGRHFAPLASWQAWLVVLKTLFALPMTAGEAECHRRHTGRWSTRSRSAIGSPSWSQFTLSEPLDEGRVDALSPGQDVIDVGFPKGLHRSSRRRPRS